VHAFKQVISVSNMICQDVRRSTAAQCAVLPCHCCASKVAEQTVHQHASRSKLTAPGLRCRKTLHTCIRERSLLVQSACCTVGCGSPAQCAGAQIADRRQSLLARLTVKAWPGNNRHTCINCATFCNAMLPALIIADKSMRGNVGPPRHDHLR
jgi:hypothetical protein